MTTITTLTKEQLVFHLVLTLDHFLTDDYTTMIPRNINMYQSDGAWQEELKKLSPEDQRFFMDSLHRRYLEALKNLSSE